MGYSMERDEAGGQLIALDKSVIGYQRSIIMGTAAGMIIIDS